MIACQQAPDCEVGIVWLHCWPTACRLSPESCLGAAPLTPADIQPAAPSHSTAGSTCSLQGFVANEALQQCYLKRESCPAYNSW